MRAKLSLLLVLSPMLAAPLPAQRLSEAFWPAPPRSTAVPVIRGERRDHDREGAIIGALLLGAAGAVVGNQICRHNRSTDFDNGCSDEVIIGGFVGAGVGGVIGYFVGKGMPRSSGS